jgi:protein SCO1
MSADPGQHAVSGSWRFLYLLLLVFSLISLDVSAQETGMRGEGGSSPGLTRNSAADYFTNLPLITQNGKEIRFFNDLLADRVVLLSGFYINCTTTSPQENLVLSRLQVLLGDRLGKDVAIVSITVDPLRDTPELVANYARVFRPRPGWTFLTGKPENVDWVNYKLGQYYEDPEQHKGTFLLGNLKTGLWKKLNPASREKELLQQIEEVLADKGGMK